MSWNWDDNEEVKKDYEVNGTVTISTTEYKDMIARVYELKAAGAKEHEDWRKEYYARQDLEKKVSTLTAKVNELDAWLESDDEARSKFRLWKLEKMEQVDE